MNKENERLKQGYCELKEKCNKGECDCTHEEYNNMCEQNIKMDLEIERLNNDYLEMKDNFRTANDEIERLNKGYCELKEKCNKGDCDCTKEEYISMCEQNIKMDLEIERLNSIIKEVREYIQKNCILSDEWTDLGFCNFIPTGKITYKQLTSKKVKGLLEILDKVNNNEDN